MIVATKKPKYTAKDYNENAFKARKGYKSPMFFYNLVKLQAHKERTGEVLPQLQMWYNFCNSASVEKDSYIPGNNVDGEGNKIIVKMIGESYYDEDKKETIWTTLADELNKYLNDGWELISPIFQTRGSNVDFFDHAYIMKELNCEISHSYKIDTYICQNCGYDLIKEECQS